MDWLALLAFGDTGWGDELLHGLGVTLALSLATFPVAIFLSFVIHWAKTSKRRPVRVVAHGYTTIFKTLPEILTLLILYYQSQAVVNWVADLIMPGSHLSVSPFLAGLIALSLVISAYGSEVVRGSLNAIGKGQTEAAQALSIIALSDLVHVATLAINTTREPFFFYLVIGGIYILLVALSTRLQKTLERRASTGISPVEARDV